MSAALMFDKTKSKTSTQKSTTPTEKTAKLPNYTNHHRLAPFIFLQ